MASSLSSDPTNQYVYLHELEEVVGKHDQTLFVWAHCGVSRRVAHPDYFTMVKRMLTNYGNIHVDLSWVVYEDTICKPRKHDTDPLHPQQVWIDEVSEPFSDRIMLGSDLCGHFDNHGKTMARYNNLLKALSPESRHKIAKDNAQQLYFKKE